VLQRYKEATFFFPHFTLLFYAKARLPWLKILVMLVTLVTCIKPGKQRPLIIMFFLGEEESPDVAGGTDSWHYLLPW